MGARKYNGGSVASTLNGAITNTALAITVTDASTWPSSGAFTVVIDRGLAGEEKILVASRAGNALTVTTRGYDGTTGSAHGNAAVIECCATATDFQEANDHINAGTDTATTDLHHTLGLGQYQAVPGDLLTRYVANFTPPVNSAEGLTQSLIGGGSVTLATGEYQILANGTSGDGALVFFGGSGLGSGVIACFTHGHVDLTCRMHVRTAGAGLFAVGVADSAASNLTVATNSCYLSLDTASGVIVGNKRVASVTTSTSTLATLAAITDMVTLRLRYPTAGGTAEFYVNDALAGTLTGVPSMGTLSTSQWNPLTFQMRSTSAAPVVVEVMQALTADY